MIGIRALSDLVQASTNTAKMGHEELQSGESLEQCYCILLYSYIHYTISTCHIVMPLNRLASGGEIPRYGSLTLVLPSCCCLLLPYGPNCQ